ncbi:MAG: glutamine--tRNA ligase/YqeY domain fusion protein [Burkholderiaceae bacterium]|nr:glutamine--tRNA ligase/YqeY domain fusion protein [Burkholderiaceae bacterium]
MNTPKKTPGADAAAEHKPTNFLRSIIERDLEADVYAGRQWGGQPGDAALHQAGQPDVAKVRLRFPPEPNGYLHVGHAKSICLNFGLAKDYGGVCHLRFDDTNPEKEEQEYVDSIIDSVKWLGFDWEFNQQSHLFYASNYFDFMYRAAEYLITAGLAYVDEQTPDEMRANRGDFNRPGTDSPFRARSPDENLARFREMRDGKHADGAMILRAKIDMASPNINLRDPALYRIRRATHHNTGDTWCIYPMYTYAHPIEDALEQITHSICTLEFEDQRPFYDWLLERLAEGGLLAHPLPKQYEFARMNLTYVITSKRKLRQLVEDQHVSGWDDPRMPTIAGIRRRGYTPEALRLLDTRTGASKNNTWIDYAWLDIALRDDLESKAHRAMVVLDPIKLVLTNWAEVFGSEDHLEACSAPTLPPKPDVPELPKREFKLGGEVWIEREDFMEVPLKGYHRLSPPRYDGEGKSIAGSMARLKYGYVIQCTGLRKNFDGTVAEIHAKILPETKSGTPGADSVKVKGVLTWVSVAEGLPAEVRLYDRLFTEAQPDQGGRDFLTVLNPDSKKTVTAYMEPTLATAKAEDRFQFERHGYFVADQKDHQGGKPVFNRITGLKDGWAK